MPMIQFNDRMCFTQRGVSFSSKSCCIVLLLAQVSLWGCTPTPRYVDHMTRMSEHIGMSSIVEIKEESPERIRLRVEGNSLIPTLDTERAFDDAMLRYCATRSDDFHSILLPLIIDRQTRLTNTWSGSVFEVIGNFNCISPSLKQELPPEHFSIPSSFPLPPPSILLNPPRHTQPKKYKGPPKVKHKRPTKSCRCIKVSVSEAVKESPKPPLKTPSSIPSGTPKPASTPIPATLLSAPVKKAI